MTYVGQNKMYLIFLQMPKMLKVLGRGSNKKPKFPRRCQRPPAMCNEPRNMQTVCAMCCSLESRVCRVRIEGRNDVVADERFPQGPVSLPWGTTRQGSTRAWNCIVFYGIVWNCMLLCGVVWYCMVLHSHRGPVSLPWGTSKQGSARAWEGKRLSLSLQICALYCTSNGVYVHRAISCVSTNPKFELLMVQYHCGLWFLPCAV